MTPLRPYLWGGGATLVLFAGAVIALHPPARRKVEASAVPADGLSTAPPGTSPLRVDRGTRKSRQDDSRAAGSGSAGAGSHGSGGVRLASAPGSGGTAPPDTAQTRRTGGTSSRLSRKR